MTASIAGVAADLAPEGVLRAAINLGNPVLAQGTRAAPAGVTVDIARTVATALDLPVTNVCFDSARQSFEAMTTGQADLCFLAIEPARAEAVAFTAPYALIEGVFVVRAGSGTQTLADVDQPGIRIAVNAGSAYDLFLTRTLKHARVVRAASGPDEFRASRLEAVAGIRQPMTEYAASRSDLRLIDDPFMQIRQAAGTTKTRQPGTIRFLHDLVEELKATGFIATSLARANQPDVTVAPPD